MSGHSWIIGQGHLTEGVRLKHYITYGLLTKCEVKMAGYWPSSFFACFGMD